MKVGIEELKKIYFGAYSFKITDDGFLQSFQYTDSQVAYFKTSANAEMWYDRSMASTAKTLEFTTEAAKISFDYRLTWFGSYDSIEFCENGRITEIFYLDDIDAEGHIEHTFEEGKKDVIVYLPADATIEIKNVEIDATFTPAVKGEKVLWLGDSITQGYGPLRSACTYVSVANRVLNYDIINQGIGGYVYDKLSLEVMDGYRPDKIIVALGTNQFETESMVEIEEYYERLTDIYKEVPVLCITPLWRGDVAGGVPTLIKFCDKLKKIAAKYEQITVVDGFELVPHLSEYYLDDLHPNCLGAEVFGRNLAEIIRKIKW